jgi:hypothetical protein
VYISSRDPCGFLLLQIVWIFSRKESGFIMCDNFDEFEDLPFKYHTDPRWDLVMDLRSRGFHAEANSLVFEIRKDFGFRG